MPMPLHGLLKRATSLIGSRSPTGPVSIEIPSAEEGEIVFSKNHVCVHAPANFREVEDRCHPGYLSIRCHLAKEGLRESPTLVLTWIPNVTLQKYPRAAESKLPNGSPGRSISTSTTPRPSSRASLTSTPSLEVEDSASKSSGNQSGEEKDSLNSKSDVSGSSTGLDHVFQVTIEEDLHGEPESGPDSSLSSILDFNLRILGEAKKNEDENGSTSPSLSTRFIPSIFTADLGQMKSLRLFCKDKKRTIGKLVIVSKEGQYKMLHFHHGGLEKFISVMESWHGLFQGQKSNAPKDSNPLDFLQFTVCRPDVSSAELHPEEGSLGIVDEYFWKKLVNLSGQLEDEGLFRKAVFFGGVQSDLRVRVWPFLLGLFPFNSTNEDRQLVMNQQRQIYRNLQIRRLNMGEEERVKFWKNVQCTVEKDVIRTDRSNPFYAGEDNPNLELMTRILLNYALHDPQIGYCQGMSDLLAPFLSTFAEEAFAFACFSALMRQSCFICSPTDADMDHNLTLLRDLMELLVPAFYAHLQTMEEEHVLDLLFCHRWILLCFKREFCEEEALQIWEACWSTHQTLRFQLFIAVAITAIYGQEVVSSRMKSDEMLLHFNALSLHMDAELVLRKARGLLYQFSRLPSLPCTLYTLCEFHLMGGWDSAHYLPLIHCKCSKKTCPAQGCLGVEEEAAEVILQ